MRETLLDDASTRPRPRAPSLVSTMAAVKMSQKEYLRKYLSEQKGSGASKKKKKKNHKFGTKTVKIIDDDVERDGATRPLREGEFDIFNITEDAPLIVGATDERGPVDFADKSRWKIIADDGEGNVACRRYASDAGPPGDAADRDSSPPRRSSEGERRSDSSPPRRTKKKRRSSRANSESDQSPPRRKKKDEGDSDIDPPRRSDEASAARNRRGEGGRLQRRRSRGASPAYDSPPPASRYQHRRRRDEKIQREDKSPRRRSRWNEDREDSGGSPVNRDSRMKKTLDGKTAGLQDARALRIETEEHKKREADLFKRMSAEVSGRGQATVLRDRRTGRKRDLGAEAAVRREKEQRQAEIDEKYAKWGRGLKQVDDQAEKRRRDLYEMSKPLARYANDADLDRELREAEREGDTMLEEIKKRQIKEGKRKADVPSTLRQASRAAPNRFGIKPGHRWDGVDRSNGYEKKWFEARNARTALAEEAYKWSTADM